MLSMCAQILFQQENDQGINIKIQIHKICANYQLHWLRCLFSQDSKYSFFKNTEKSGEEGRSQAADSGSRSFLVIPPSWNSRVGSL